MSEHTSGGVYSSTMQPPALVHHEVAALLSEATTWVEQAHHIACDIRKAIWKNPTLAEVFLNDMTRLQTAALEHTSQIALLLSANAIACEMLHREETPDMGDMGDMGEEQET